MQELAWRGVHDAESAHVPLPAPRSPIDQRSNWPIAGTRPPQTAPPSAYADLPNTDRPPVIPRPERFAAGAPPPPEWPLINRAPAGWTPTRPPWPEHKAIEPIDVLTVRTGGPLGSADETDRRTGLNEPTDGSLWLTGAQESGPAAEPVDATAWWTGADEPTVELPIITRDTGTEGARARGRRWMLNRAKRRGRGLLTRDRLNAAHGPDAVA
ncbi:MAG: hypothetical protein QOC94_3411 [Actinoplanes sp.]|jgi:hypothetical protein|nr:hypothetical protein [Actinoplanes sp.]